MSNFNKIHYGAVIEFLMLYNVQPQVLHNWMTVACGEDVLSYVMVKLWTAVFIVKQNKACLLYTSPSPRD